MRIAILIYGRLNKCVEHYNNILEHIGKHNDIDFFLSSDNSSESLLNDFIHLYKPIAYNNEQIRYDYDLAQYPRRIETNMPNMICHFINKNRVLILLEEYISRENIHYDCVVSLRIDCVFQTTFNFNNLEDSTIYIPSGNDHTGINDQIAYGKMDVMTKYNSINVRDLLEKKLSIAHPESLTLANILFNKMCIKRIILHYHLDR